MEKRLVEDMHLKKHMSVNDLIENFEKSGGFTAKKIAQGVTILKNMMTDKKCIRMLSFPACIISTGVRGVIVELLKQKLVDVIITTCGTLDHDLARVWKPYLHGSFQADDRILHQQNLYRLGNIFIPIESYGPILEQKMQPILQELYQEKKKWSTKELVWAFGQRLESVDHGNESITYWSWKHNIPMFIPGPTDGAFGSQLWLFYQNHRDFIIDVLQDEQDLSDMMFTANKTGALVIGGGISKHHTIWWNQFKDGLDYAVYITTAVEYDGSLSGAQTREAISWGKITETAENITIDGDATVILPLMIASLLDRLS
jgi:deoxyhypusine synthase